MTTSSPTTSSPTTSSPTPSSFTPSSFTIVTIERRTRSGMMASLVLAPGVQDGTPDVSGLYAKVEFHDIGAKDPITLELSQMSSDGDQWGIDARWLANGYPIHSNGFGARYLIVKRAADDLAATLNAAALEAGLR